jgi:hypothetical protein
MWRQSRERLQTIFATLFTPPDLATRRAHNFLEDDTLVLFRTAATIVGDDLDILLEAVRPVATPHVVRLVLFVAGTAAPGLRATIHWGDYADSVSVDERGRAQFSPLPLASIVDEAGERIIADLQLVLERVS